MAAPPAKFVHDLALAAMQGLIANETFYSRLERSADVFDIDSATQLAQVSYIIAEAMMVEAASH